MPSKTFMASYAEAEDASETRAAPGRDIRTTRIHRGEGPDTAGSFMLGVGDTVTFGFLDEAGAFVDSIGLTDGRENVWNSDRGFGEILDANIDANRSILHQAEEEHGTAYLTGQLAGALVPVGSKLAAGKGIKGALTSGAIMGGAYGFGSGEDGLDNRLESAAVGGLLGGLGGYVLEGMVVPAGRWGLDRARLLLKKGSAVRMEEALIPPTLSREAAAAADNVRTPSPRQDPLGLDTSVKLGARESVSDTIADGALISARELLGDPGAARASIAKRLGKLSGVEAEKLYNRIAQAEADGTVLTDPHYRSLLGIDLSDTSLTTEEVIQAAEAFEFATSKLAERAGIKPRTVAGMESEVGKELKKGVTLGDLEDAYDLSQKGYVKARIAQHVVLTTTAKVIRLRTELLPDVLKGVDGARDRLAEELTDAAHRFTLARGILSNAGRTLGILSHGTRARMVDVADDIFELESREAIQKRVKQSLGELGDDGLTHLLSRIRTLSDSDKLADVLMNPAEAAAVSTWQRTLNSVSLFLRSNALTPATGLFNTVGFVLNDFFRNDLAKSWAARGLVKAGRVEEGLALKLEHEAGRAVYWKAHKDGLKALFKRVQWEFWTDVERIAGVGWGNGVVAAKAGLKRTTMMADGFVPPELREFSERLRLNVTDTAEFNTRIDAARTEAGDTAFANLIYHLQRARAVTANVVDAGGSAAMKLFTGSIDDWGREFVKVKETYSQATRFAIREAVEARVPQEKLTEYVQRRATELSELPTSDLLQRVDAALVASDGPLQGEAAFLVDLQKLVENESERVLFLDGPQSAHGKAAANFLQKVHPVLTAVFVPFVRTPIRLFEQGVVNYGPLASRSAEVQGILARGARPGATADEKLAASLEQARVEIGTTVFQMGLAFGMAGAVTATNGGYENSGNLDAGPANRINLPGGGFFEFGRVDPFAFTLGMGAMVGQAYKAGYADGTEYDQHQALITGLSTAYLAARDSILDKSYLKGLQDLMELATAENLETALGTLERTAGGAVGRLVPLGGISRQVNESFRSSSMEAVGFMDQLLRHIPGAGWGMSPRVDPLGDEVKGRTLGINFGNSELTEGQPMSPVKAELRRLGIDINTIRKSDPDGFNLTSEELSEVRRVRGKEAVNDRGQTMEEALSELFSDPRFQSLPSKDQKRSEVVDTMREFNKPAWAILAERSPGFASKQTYTKSLADYMAQGMARRDAEGMAREDVAADGLPDPDL
ncbi:hypothetical protein QUC32_23125 [Novosphingobium resinovorum]|uniref:hypothetical protein n=1 Tax=Novosphingobium TaxID=165696 RepID=UPI001B3C8230|nr:MULTISPECIES: hypothetical protein [Novosphingobium]MBF7012544.1 hypothetical protein [Novosphingobium sp. HR1a]WJM27278.1 hypothetical protein QUC32_23125 [Novosphingobium resinovorum]